MITALIFSDDALLEECAQAAQERGWHLCGNGQRIIVSSFVPAGFDKIAVKIKSATAAHREAIQCAA